MPLAVAEIRTLCPALTPDRRMFKVPVPSVGPELGAKTPKLVVAITVIPTSALFVWARGVAVIGMLPPGADGDICGLGARTAEYAGLGTPVPGREPTVPAALRLETADKTGGPFATIACTWN